LGKGGGDNDGLCDGDGDGDLADAATLSSPIDLKVLKAEQKLRVLILLLVDV
jgi:hypothetical protein